METDFFKCCFLLLNDAECERNNWEDKDLMQLVGPLSLSPPALLSCDSVLLSPLHPPAFIPQTLTQSHTVRTVSTHQHNKLTKPSCLHICRTKTHVWNRCVLPSSRHTVCCCVEAGRTSQSLTSQLQSLETNRRTCSPPPGTQAPGSSEAHTTQVESRRSRFHINFLNPGCCFSQKRPPQFTEVTWASGVGPHFSWTLQDLQTL